MAPVAATRPNSSPPNVVLILIDTLRPDHLDLYGYSKPTAPFLASLGSNAAVFDQAFSSSSWTAPATASVFTGLYPPEHGIVEGFRAHRRRKRTAESAGADSRSTDSTGLGTDSGTDLGNESGTDSGAGSENGNDARDDGDGDVIETTLHLNRLPEEIPTLPELFAGQGYRTFGLTTNINIDELMGFRRGFSQFECMVHADAEQTVARLDAWSSDLAEGGPYFLYLHFMDVHVPYHAREPLYVPGRNVLEDVKARYDSEIHYLDEHLAELFDRYRWGDNTLLCVISDHGEEFRERGAIGHHFSLYREVNHVLWMVHGPAQGVIARRLDENVSLVDVAPTLLDLAGLELPADRSGLSLRPLLTQEESPSFRGRLDERTLFAHRLERFPTEQHLWSAIRGSYRMIEHQPSGDQMLFDFHRDPGERRDLIGVRSEVGDALRTSIETLRSHGIRHSGDVDVEMDDDLRRSLELLGYLEPEQSTGKSGKKKRDGQ